MSKKPINNDKNDKKKDLTPAIVGASVGAAVGAKVAIKTIVTFVSLGLVLVLLIVGLILVVKGGKNDGSQGATTDTSDIPQVDVWEGEGIYGTTVLLAYPMIDENKITRIELFDEDGSSYVFLKGWDESRGAYRWQIQGYESIQLNQSTFEMLCVWLSIATTKEPVRNATSEQLADFGLDESCKRGYSISFTNELGVEQTYRVRIGNKVMSSSDVYYSQIEGRPHVYKLDNDIHVYTSFPKTQYMQPIINTFFASETAAINGIDKFGIYKTQGSDTSLSNILTVSVSERSEGGVEFKVTYAPDEYGRKRVTMASTTYLSEIFTLLYTSFSGQEIVEIDPDEETLKRYGLGKDDPKYFIDAEFSSNASFASASLKTKEPSFYVSMNIEGYHYVLSKYHGKDVIVKLADDTFYFLKTDDASLLKWADTSSVKSGFFETLVKSEESGAPGINKIVLKTEKNEETFILSYNETTSILAVTAKNSGLIFEDNPDATLASDKNQFRTLYVSLLYYPFIEDFNKKPDEEIKQIVANNNIAYSITAYRNDGVVVKYDYYELSASLAMECAMKGTVQSDGTVVYGEPEYNYIVTMEHVRRVCDVIDKLLAGEHISAPI